MSADLKHLEKMGEVEGEILQFQRAKIHKHQAGSKQFLGSEGGLQTLFLNVFTKIKYVLILILIIIYIYIYNCNHLLHKSKSTAECKINSHRNR